MKIDINKASNAEDSKTLKDFIRVRIPLAVKMCKEMDKEENGVIKVNDLKTMIYNFKLPQRFLNDSVLNPLIDKFKDKDENINYKNFIEHIVDQKDLNDFFDFKDKHIEKIRNKIQSSKEKMQASYVLIKQEEDKKHALLEELEKNIQLHEEAKQKEKSKDKHNFYEKHINAYQPSMEFTKQLFKDKEAHAAQYRTFESNFSAHPSLRKEMVVQTRYGANPPYQNTKWITQPTTDSGMFISEGERFSKSNTYFQQQEKQLRTMKYANKINIIQFYNDQNENKKNMETMLKDQKKLYSLNQRTEKLHKYEVINKVRNELVE